MCIVGFLWAVGGEQLGRSPEEDKGPRGDWVVLMAGEGREPRAYHAIATLPPCRMYRTITRYQQGFRLGPAGKHFPPWVVHGHFFWRTAKLVLRGTALNECFHEIGLTVERVRGSSPCVLETKKKSHFFNEGQARRYNAGASASLPSFWLYTSSSGPVQSQN